MTVTVTVIVVLAVLAILAVLAAAERAPGTADEPGRAVP